MIRFVEDAVLDKNGLWLDCAIDDSISYPVRYIRTAIRNELGLGRRPVVRYAGDDGDSIRVRVPKALAPRLGPKLTVPIRHVVSATVTKTTCNPACWNARGLDCECSCAGVNHSEGFPPPYPEFCSKDKSGKTVVLRLDSVHDTGSAWRWKMTDTETGATYDWVTPVVGDLEKLRQTFSAFRSPADTDTDDLVGKRIVAIVDDEGICWLTSDSGSGR